MPILLNSASAPAPAHDDGRAPSPTGTTVTDEDELEVGDCLGHCSDVCVRVRVLLVGGGASKRVGGRQATKAR